MNDLFDFAPPRRALSHTLEAQTGWVRPWPQMVCQDWSVLNRLQHFVYELTEEFMDYTRARMGIDLRTCECGFERARRIYAPDAAATQGHVRAMQARFHDLWELFQASKLKAA